MLLGINRVKTSKKIERLLDDLFWVGDVVVENDVFILSTHAFDGFDVLFSEIKLSSFLAGFRGESM